MRHPYLFYSVIALLLISCGGGGKSKIDEIKARSIKAEPTSLAEAENNWKDYQGFGPVDPFDLPAEINQELAVQGEEVYSAKCTACHKPDKRFIGPAPKGILEKRNPAWIMNMILNPEEMVQKDPLAKQLLIEFNGSPMANQNLTKEEARAVLEYFRTL